MLTWLDMLREEIYELNRRGPIMLPSPSRPLCSALLHVLSPPRRWSFPPGPAER